jgi:hypothetical protein
MPFSARPRTRRALATLIATLACLLTALAGSAVAAAPSNDAFSGPAITLGSITDGTNIDATGETGEPNHANVSRRAGCTSATTPDTGCLPSVWYTLTPASSGLVTLTLCDAATDYDTTIAVYTGSAVNALTSVASDDDTGCSPNGLASSVSFTATATVPYRIAVTGYSAEQGHFRLHAFAGPQAVISGPTGHVNPDATPLSYDIASSTGGATFECQLDAGGFAPCTSPQTYGPSQFAEGSTHTLSARATSGGVTGEASAVTFTVDRTPPDTFIDTGPLGTVASSTADFTFHSTESDQYGYFSCSLDSAPIQYCSNQDHTTGGGATTIANLCDTSHAFGVQAFDEAGNRDPSAATRSWIVSGGGGVPCAAPTAVTGSAGGGGPTYANPGGSVNPNGEGTAFYFEYGTTTAYGSTDDPEAVPIYDLGTSHGVGEDILFLSPMTLYHYRIVAVNPSGTTRGSDQTVTTGAASGAAPSATTGTATAVGTATATMNGVVNDNGNPCVTYRFEYGTSAAYGSHSPAANFCNGGDYAASFPLSGLAQGTTYHFRVEAANDGGTVFGSDATFTTAREPAASPPAPSPPVIVPTTASSRPSFAQLFASLSSSLRQFAAQLNGKDPRKLAKKGYATAQFRWLVPGTVKFALTVPASVARQFHAAKAKTVVIATGSKKLSVPGTATFRVRLTAKGKKLLKRAKKLKITVRGTFTPAGAGAMTSTRTFTLKRR